LIKVENREAFKADEASYLDRFSLTADQTRLTSCFNRQRAIAVSAHSGSCHRSTGRS
jgi:Aromatic-ring-opening dioxygenase LigAB, LigA subunit